MNSDVALVGAEEAPGQERKVYLELQGITGSGVAGNYRVLIDLPEEYLLWFANKEFPQGKLGKLMKLTLAIKIEGLESLVHPLAEACDLFLGVVGGAAVAVVHVAARVRSRDPGARSPCPCCSSACRTSRTDAIPTS